MHRHEGHRLRGRLPRRLHPPAQRRAGIRTDDDVYIIRKTYIDCSACVPACPVAAIYESVDATPSNQKDLIEGSSVYRNGDPEAMSRADAVVQAHLAADVLRSQLESVGGHGFRMRRVFVDG